MTPSSLCFWWVPYPGHRGAPVKRVGTLCVCVVKDPAWCLCHKKLTTGMVIKLGSHAELPSLKTRHCYFPSFYEPGGEEGALLCTKVQRHPAKVLRQDKAALTCPWGAALAPHIRCTLSLNLSPYGRPWG